MVLLSVSSEESLIQAVERANQQGIQTAVFFEPDQRLGFTAACTEPVMGHQRSIFRKYALWQP